MNEGEEEIGCLWFRDMMTNIEGRVWLFVGKQNETLFSQDVSALLSSC